MKAKAGELGNRTKRRLKEFNKVLKTGTSTQYDKGLRAGREGVIREIKDYQNPYPKDVFTWDNKTDMKITRGRFNEFIHLVVENVKHDLVRDLKEWEGFKHDL